MTAKIHITETQTPTSSQTSQGDIRTTDSAICKVWELIQEAENPRLMLRVSVTGGGCSGFQYEFAFDDQSGPQDITFPKQLTEQAWQDARIIHMARLLTLATLTHMDTSLTALACSTHLWALKKAQKGIVIVIDRFSLRYLQGSEIDYANDVQGQRFIMRNNPNAKTTCGCGASFDA